MKIGHATICNHGASADPSYLLAWHLFPSVSSNPSHSIFVFFMLLACMFFLPSQPQPYSFQPSTLLSTFRLCQSQRTDKGYDFAFPPRLFFCYRFVAICVSCFKPRGILGVFRTSSVYFISLSCHYNYILLHLASHILQPFLYFFILNGRVNV